MAKWTGDDFFDNGFNAFTGGSVTRMLLLKAYTANDSYATVVGNAIASVTMTGSDFTKSGGAGAARVLTVAANKTTTATASSGAAPNLHIAFTDGSTKVYWVTDETTDQVITSGNTITFPGFTYTSNQPT